MYIIKGYGYKETTLKSSLFPSARLRGSVGELGGITSRRDAILGSRVLLGVGTLGNKKREE
jgi:hypothetical protein